MRTRGPSAVRRRCAAMAARRAARRRFERGGDAVAHRGEDRAPLDGDRVPKHTKVSFDHLVHLRHPLPARVEPSMSVNRNVKVERIEGVASDTTSSRSRSRIVVSCCAESTLVVVHVDHEMHTAGLDGLRRPSWLRTSGRSTTYVYPVRAHRRAHRVALRRACDRSGRGECRQYASRSRVGSRSACWEALKQPETRPHALGW